MEIFSLKSPPSVSHLPSSLLRRDGVQKPTSFFGQTLARKSNPDARNDSFPNYRLRASVFAQLSAGSISKTGDVKKDESSKDNDIVFVAGATGRVGSRTVRQLLKLGFRVRAGVRSAKRAERLVQSVRQMETQPIEKLEIVECDLENESSICPALGNASIVICCIGASEKEVFDITGPYRIDYKATKNLIDAATAMKVDHFILLTSLGTNKIGFPAAILNLFWGVLCWKRKAEEALISSGLPYTIVRPGGMERPTDSYKETHNIIVANEDTYFGGQVSNLQVAELMAVMAKHRRLSLCKVVEVIAETTAPLTPMDELLAKIPPKQELPAEPKPDPIPLLKTESEPITSTVDKEVDDEEVPKPKPLSPFAMYADLKPPTSPCPTPSTGAAVSKQKIDDPVQDEPTTTLHTEMKSDNASNRKGYHLSPYIAYDDVKPPTSPTPSTPSTSTFISTSAVVDNSPTSGPLSPYTMYEDLKPPTSPVPSVPKY